MWIIYVITSLRLSVSCAYIDFVLNQGGNESNQVRLLLLLLLHLLFLLLFRGAFISTAVPRICFSFLSRWRWSWIHPTTTTTVQHRLVTRQDNEQGRAAGGYWEMQAAVCVLLIPQQRHISSSSREAPEGVSHYITAETRTFVFTSKSLIHITSRRW